MVFLKVFVRKKQLSNADKHFAMDFLCQAASINLSGVKDEPGRLPPSTDVVVCHPQSSPGAETESEKERGKKSPLDLLTGGESRDHDTRCNLLTPVFTARAVLLQRLTMLINRLTWRPVGGGFESAASPVLPLAAQQQADRKESSKTHQNVVDETEHMVGRKCISF